MDTVTPKYLQIAELGQILLNFANIVPAGMIVFFPSYKFLNTAKSLWTNSGMLSKLSAKKEVQIYVDVMDGLY